MYCPKCKKTFADDLKYCSDCGADLEPSSPSSNDSDTSQTDQNLTDNESTSSPPSHVEKGQTFKGDAVITRSKIGDEIGGDKIEGDVLSGDKVGGNKIIYTTTPEELFRCSRCYHNVKKDETFYCTVCEDTFCSARCYDAEYNCCKKCAKEIAAKENFDCKGCYETVKIQKTFICRRCGRRWCRKNCHDAEYDTCRKCAKEIKEREPNRDLLCRAQFAFEGGHKVFIIAKEQVGFGRKKKVKNRDVDIVLRLLPTRSPELDPENWQKSRKIGGCHGFFAYRKGGVHLKDNNSRNGIFKVPGKLEADLLSQSMTDFDGTEPENTGVEVFDEKEVFLKPFKKGIWSSLHDHCMLSLGKSGIILLKTSVIRKAGQILAFKIERVSNCPQHEYVQLISKVIIGNSDTSAIKLNDPVVSGEAAELIWEDVTFYLKRLGDKIDMTVDSRLLKADEKVMLMEGNRITIGNTSLTYTTATDDDFVNV